MKTTMDIMNKIIEKYWLPKTADFILRERFCDKHIKEFIKKNKLQKRKELRAISLPSICSVCHKPGICSYIEGNL